MFSTKSIRTMGWSMGTAVVVALLTFFSSKENIAVEKLKELPPMVITAAASAGLAYRAGLRTDPEELDEKDEKEKK